MSRVDRLGETAKNVLRTASVIGRSFLYSVLRRIAEEERCLAELDGCLAELQEIELIRVNHYLPELEYAFTHALARDAIYQSILQQRRRDLHARVGQTIETLFADRVEEFYGLLAYHYVQAESWEKGRCYWMVQFEPGVVGLVDPTTKRIQEMTFAAANIEVKAATPEILRQLPELSAP